ncbi:unnamed protein product [Protopolystoma xenopodis]|uniref:Uncharacterized protein n=1 Tax=Protopolystoma xenopodis TaxID=117903 RepID=A0A448WJS1_9PLAT|nr:unnamed protein product [Protopolystoma xenopodis]
MLKDHSHAGEGYNLLPSPWQLGLSDRQESGRGRPFPGPSGTSPPDASDDTQAATVERHLFGPDSDANRFQLSIERDMHASYLRCWIGVRVPLTPATRGDQKSPKWEMDEDVSQGNRVIQEEQKTEWSGERSDGASGTNYPAGWPPSDQSLWNMAERRLNVLCKSCNNLRR